jgi:hypothetical protein
MATTYIKKPNGSLALKDESVATSNNNVLNIIDFNFKCVGWSNSTQCFKFLTFVSSDEGHIKLSCGGPRQVDHTTNISFNIRNPGTFNIYSGYSTVHGVSIIQPNHLDAWQYSIVFQFKGDTTDCYFCSPNYNILNINVVVTAYNLNSYEVFPNAQAYNIIDVKNAANTVVYNWYEEYAAANYAIGTYRM